MNISTIEIYDTDLETWKRWKRKTGMRSKDLMRRIMREVELQNRQAFYRTLPMPVKYRKPLFGKRLEKNYRK